ncbi:M28 family metallopeptidase [Pseudotenacibaculum haliotis]|uniref:M28 family metallopeptidase n=1 Tax=Pseudotenacibaculum haliotis TaxID=1862138 RepID=A0ABW5LTF6_9FLAO
MKKILLAASMLALVSCGSTQDATTPKKAKKSSADTNVDLAVKYASTITAKDLGNHLFTYASDEFEGRDTGEPGQKKAVEYLKNFYVAEGIPSPLGGDDYYQEVPASYLNKFSRGKDLKDSENVLAFIKGTEKPDEIVVISAHLDHVGVNANGEVYNGADDDGSGTVAILEIAEAFKKAADAGHGPKRSILFLHVTGEEKGLLGSRFYTENPTFPIANTVTDLNIDMIGRVDERHKGNPNYVYLIGSDKLSTELHNISEAMNKKYTNIELDYKYNDDNDPNRFYYRSDHYNFAQYDVPIIFYFNGTHEDYHAVGDTPDKINYEMLEKRARLVFHTAWEVANMDKRIVADKAKKKDE